jgi:hypothetical protein
MNKISIQALCALMAVSMLPSCMNTYDSYGHPVQSVDPGAAVGAAALAGVAGYAIGQNNGKKEYYGGPYYGGRRPYYGRPLYYGGRRYRWEHNRRIYY